MISRLLVVTAILFLNITSFASPYNKWWDEGNRFYNQKQYDSAAYYFEQIATLKPQDAAVYYNLGNTYYRLNQVGLAVLNYERALHISPLHKEAKDNLLLAQSRIIKPIPVAEDIFFVRWWNAITAQSNTTLWSVISLIFFISVIGLAILKILGKVHFPTGKLQASIISLWLLTMIFAFASTNHKLSARAVIMDEGTPLMNNIKAGKSIGNVPEGTTVKIEKEEGAMIEVTLPDGRSGWVDKSSLIKI